MSQDVKLIIVEDATGLEPDPNFLILETSTNNLYRGTGSGYTAIGSGSGGGGVGDALTLNMGDRLTGSEVFNFGNRIYLP